MKFIWHLARPAGAYNLALVRLETELRFWECTKMQRLGYIVFLCVEIAAVSTVNSRNNGSERRMKRFSKNSNDFSGIALHSYMKQLYNTRARGNGNGSFTISLRNQKILATTIRGFGTERNGKYGEEVRGITFNVSELKCIYLGKLSVT